MDFLQMKYYVEIYNTRNITKASKHLYISQQRLSQVLKNLEKELGGLPLFHRTREGLTPTSEGQVVYQSFRRMLDEFDALHRQLDPEHREQYSGSLRVTMDLGLMTIITSQAPLSFSKRFPNMELNLYEHRYDNCKRLLMEGEYDMGMSISLGWHGDFMKREICQLQMSVLLYPGHPLKGRKFLTAADLAKHRTIISGAVIYYTLLEDFRIAGIKPNFVLGVNDYQVCMDFFNDKKGICPVIYSNQKNTPDIPSYCTVVPYRPQRPAVLYSYWNEESAKQDLIHVFTDYLIKQLC